MNPLIPSAKTIQIYLPKGNPRGLRLAEMTTRTVRLIEIPRIHIDDFFAMPEANQVGLYFLIGDTDSIDKPLLYIGQTGDLKRRLNQHHEKDFWTRAFVMLSTNNSMTQTHALYMEHKAIATAIEVGRYEIKNGNTGNRPHTPDPLKADCEELFYTLDVLLSTLGQPIFESLSINNKSANSNEISPIIDTKNTICIGTNLTQISSTQLEPTLFYCKTHGTSAKGYYDDDGFVVLSGSLINKRTTASASSWAINKRKEMLSANELIEYDSELYELIENLLCKTPSGGSDFVLGSSSNGWKIWKNQAGQTLDSIYR
ncbi:putative GIY-YIG superfamily endonuclease [Psychrobacter luti]|uniref:Putative GIY-YIG superfamily endonuclease n=1 Tax=Psychrobacter luti TaxID=198481 RepID=A0A839TE51_9GAMM|nr:GIY-YIG nuclease family protein [Psychrobacter luti]MBB3107478.1 putative GIY-YIG superfamily endonuclease [Psychrobacter luti]